MKKLNFCKPDSSASFSWQSLDGGESAGVWACALRSGVVEREPGPCRALPGLPAKTYLLTESGWEGATALGREPWDKLYLLFSLPSGQLCSTHHILGSSAPEVHSGAKNRLCLDTLGLRLETRTAVTKHCHSCKRASRPPCHGNSCQPREGGRVGGFMPTLSAVLMMLQSRSHVKCKGMKL